ncbi:hypothetical protein [Janibacter sp. HTCC2649]|uniref:hypothetical protein n=1 Tax=Janibacter sp. HTCC2649 TaxID=313589 RepID=UPI0003255B66|nr:hypothetical protein [Janibacter sp. HTCC2649]
MTPQEIWAKLVDTWNRLMEKAQVLLEAFNRGLKEVGKWFGWLAEKIANFWNDKVVPKWQEAVDWMSKHLNVFGAPWLCFSQAAQWREHVGSPVSARSGLATKGQLDVDTTWKGSAAQSYVDRLGQQEKAIGGVSTQFAEVIATSLVKVGAGIIVWWVGVVAAIAALIIFHIVAAAAAATVVGAPATPPSALAGWITFISALLVGTAALVALSINAKSDLDGVKNKLSDYPEGAWPTFG